MDYLDTLTRTEIKKMKATTVKAGIFTALGLILYFSIMRLFNLHLVLGLHYFNAVILFFGLRYVLKHLKNIKGEIKYLEGLKSGLLVTIIALVIFNGFMIIYETLIDPAFLTYLQERITFGGGTISKTGTVVNIAGIISIEGMASGFIMTFALMQYYKNDRSLSS